MGKFILLLKQYWMVAVAGVVIGGFALSSLSGEGPLGAADGKKKGGNSINDLLRDGKKGTKTKTPSSPAPTRDDLGLGDGDLEAILKPPTIDQELVDQYNEELCAKNNSDQGSSHPSTTGEIRRVRYIDMNHYYREDSDNAVECLIAIYAKGCDDFAYYSVLASRGPNTRFSDVSKNLCKTAEKAMLNKTPVTAAGILVPANGVTPGAVHRKLLTLELG